MMEEGVDHQVDPCHVFRRTDITVAADLRINQGARDNGIMALLGALEKTPSYVGLPASPLITAK